MKKFRFQVFISAPKMLLTTHRRMHMAIKNATAFVTDEKNPQPTCILDIRNRQVFTASGLIIDNMEKWLAMPAAH